MRAKGQQTQQGHAQAHSYQNAPQNQTQRFMQQQQQQTAHQQRQRSNLSQLPPQGQTHKPPYEQSLYRHPAQANSANFAQQYGHNQQAYGSNNGYGQNDMYPPSHIGMSPHQGGMHMGAGMPGSSLGAAYSPYSNIGSMPDGSSVEPMLL